MNLPVIPAISRLNPAKSAGIISVHVANRLQAENLLGSLLSRNYY
jgi:hypothetical protein